MYRSYHQRHRKPDILFILVAVVGIATAVTLSFHLHLAGDKVPITTVLHR
ncbi:hypothetical protein [Solemya velesiana gill symbiont]|nr:hypothetical protein [Solemya velesiana gill symbiont]